MVAMFALPVGARNLITPQDIASQDQCSPAAKDALYASFLKNRASDQAKAYEDAKKYLGCPAVDVSEAQKKIIDYLKKYTAAYQQGERKIRLVQLLYNEQKYAEAYALGKEILAAEPDELKVLVDLGVNGYLVAPLNNASLSTEALAYARKALQLLEAGKTLKDWAPLTSQEVAIAYLNYTAGTLTLENDPTTALHHLMKVVQYETPLKKSAYTFAYIAGAYETGPYRKLSEEYKRMYAGKYETAESKLALANIDQLIDPIIDAYARAVALAGTDPKFNTPKSAWNESLITFYKFRNNGSDAGLIQMINTVLSKPMPPEPKPLTSLPESPAKPPIQ
jgi:hypothetical protein